MPPNQVIELWRCTHRNDLRTISYHQCQMYAQIGKIKPGMVWLRSINQHQQQLKKIYHSLLFIK